MNDSGAGNSSSPNFEDFVTPWEERVSCAVLFTSLCIFGVITNGIVIMLTLTTDLRKQLINFFVANMALSDFMCTAVFALGQNFYILYRETMPYGGCVWLALFNTAAAMQEFVFPPFLAINRYVSLYHSHLYRRIYTRRNMLLIAISSWLYSFTIPSVFVIGGRMGYDKRNEHCCVLAEGNFWWTIIYWCTIAGPLICIFDPITVMCNWKVYRKLHGHVTKRDGSMVQSAIREHREIMTLLLIDLFIPICSHSLYSVFKFTLRRRYSLFSRQIFTGVYLATSGVRGVVILRTLRPYRCAFKEKFLCARGNTVVAVSGTVKEKGNTGNDMNENGKVRTEEW